MREKNTIYNFWVKLSLALLCWSVFIYHDFFSEVFAKIESELLWAAITLSGIVIFDVVTFIIHNFQYSRIIIQSYNPFKQKDRLRVSMAYLIRIHDDGKYLLVKNPKRNGQYQPVGGVYKYHPTETERFIRELEAERDQITDVDNGYSDLRLFMSKRKNLYKLIQWFKLNINRESDPWREFQEELIDPGIIDGSQVKYIDYNLIKKIHIGILKDKDRDNIDTYKYWEVFDLLLVNLDHKNEFKNLMNSEDDRIIWATSQDILNGYQMINGKKVIISNPSKSLLEAGKYRKKDLM